MSYLEYEFQRKIESCIEQLHQVLQANKTGIHLKSAENTSHRYEDKYLLVEQVGGLFGECVMSTLGEMGLTGEKLETMLQWLRAEGEDVNLRFERLHTCQFVKETTREEESPRQLVEEKTGFLNQKTVYKSVTRITEYHYELTATYRLVGFKGHVLTEEGDGDAVGSVVLLERAAVQNCVMRGKTFPFPECTKKHYDVKLTWLLKLLSPRDADGGHVGDELVFHIDRNQTSCHTPRRNEDVEKALAFADNFGAWSREVHSYMVSVRASIVQQYDNSESSVGRVTDWNAADVLMPVVPLLVAGPDIVAAGGVAVANTRRPLIADEEDVEGEDANMVVVAGGAQEQGQEGKEGTHTCLDSGTVEKILAGQKKSLQAKLREVESLLGGQQNEKLISQVECKLVVCVDYVDALVRGLESSVEYVEGMLTKQLIAAIGKTLTPSDLADYMKYHYRQVLREEYQPRPFCYAVRRSSVHSPEGTVRIEMKNGNTGNTRGGTKAAENEMMMTICREYSPAEVGDKRKREHMIEFPINASTKIQLGGERYLHGWLGHAFSNDEALPQMSLVADTRQFSSYIVLLGRVTGANGFEAQHGFIVQNKDELTIPLMLETIPTPKQFRDAIESLSPNQQAFAKAYRSMQLSHTLFGMAVIQIKPQLEKVLRLDEDSLTKEIKLTQELMKLFVEYQIPSDLLSYDGESEGVSGTAKVERVRGLVGDMFGMIKQAKEDEIAEKEREREYLYGRRQEESKGGGGGVDGADLFGQLELVADTAKFYRRSSPVHTSAMSWNSQPRVVQAPMPAAVTMAMPMAMPAMSFGGPPPPPPAAALAYSSVAPQQATTSSTTHVVVNPPPSNLSTTSSASSVVAPTRDGRIESCEGLDVTKFPALLDKQYEQYDGDNAIRPAILNVGAGWKKESAKGLLAARETSWWSTPEEQGNARKAAFDLLDALTRSGGLAIEQGCSFHVIVAGVHQFDQSLMQTIIQKNVNPIVSVERSYLLMAATLQGVSVPRLLSEQNHQQRDRIAEEHAQLLSINSGEAE